MRKFIAGFVIGFFSCWGWFLTQVISGKRKAY